MDRKVCRIDCSVFRPIPRPHRALADGKERLMLAFRSLWGYRYYYCQDGGNVCAYLFLKRNYLGYYGFMEPTDLLVNPCKTLPAYRRQGYAAALLRQVVEDAAREGQRIYAVVVQDNQASRSALLKAGFRKIGYGEHKPRRLAGSQLVITEKQTNLLIFAFDGRGRGGSEGED